MADYSYIGVGKVYMREAGAAAPMLMLGDVSALNFKVNEDVKELKDYTQVGGGTYNEVRRIDSVEASMTLHDLSAENLAKAVFGTASAIASGTVTDESHVAYIGGFIPLDFPGTVTSVKKSPSTSATEGTDYQLAPGGIIILTGGIFADADTALITYTKAAGNAVQALLSSAKEYEIFFSGLNEARSGKAVSVRAYRVKLGATQNLPLIGDDFAALELTGKVLKDTTKNGTSVSQYFAVQIVT